MDKKRVRMTKSSKQAILTADRAVIEHMKDGWVIRLEEGIRPDKDSYVCTLNDLAYYQSPSHARRAIMGIRRDLLISISPGKQVSSGEGTHIA